MTAKMILGVVLGLAGFAGIAHAGDDVPIVTQGGATATLADVEGFLRQQVPEDKRQGFLGSASRVNQMLIGILRDKELANQAVTMKLDQDPQVQAQLAYARIQILSAQRMHAFEAALKVPSFEEVAKEQYLAHKSDYVSPKVVDVQHVLISLKGRTDDEAKALADKVHAEAVASPAGFDELVAKHSEDPSKAGNKGMIPGATSGGYVPEFAAAASKLKTVGEISPVVKTSYGYHVLKLARIVPAKPQEFAAVKEQMIAKLKQDYLAEQRTAFLNKLDSAQASVNPEGMEALRKRFNLDAAENIGEAINATAKPAPKP